MEHILSDESTYIQIKSNPTKDLKTQLQDLVNKAGDNNILIQREKRYLVPDAPIMLVLYQVPKIHKNVGKPPGRPVLSGHSLFSRLGEYIDVFLQPLAAKSLSYLKDSKDVINNLQNLRVNDSGILVTVDVESLYTNIQQQDALNEVKWSLNKYTTLKYKQKQFILHGLKLAMTNNFFWYGDNITTK